MRRLQISVDDEVDELLDAEAARRRISKAAVVRELVKERLGRKGTSDPMAGLIGDIDDDAGAIDAVVYER